VKRILTPLQDSEILRIKQQWDLHMTLGSNSQTCSTCGIIGLADPREYPLQNPCINAFKVLCLVSMSRFSCVYLKCMHNCALHLCRALPVYAREGRII